MSITAPNPSNDINTWVYQVSIIALDLLATGYWADTPVGAKVPAAYLDVLRRRAAGETVSIPPGLSTWLAQWARDLAANWGTYGPQLTGMGWSLGSPPSGTTPDISDQIKLYEIDKELEGVKYQADKQLEAAKYQADKHLQGMLAQANATIKASENHKEATITAARIAADADMYVADRRKEADIAVANIHKEATLGAAQIAADTEYKIFVEAEAGRNRRFDLQLAEDQRQFNAMLALDLYKLGIELARNPVDWIAYQYYLGGYGVPATAHNLMATAALFGAVPPSGPSNYGPVTGGPATYSGQWGAAAITGAMPGFMSVSGAVEINPANVPIESWMESVLQNLGNWDMMLAPARDELAQMTGMPEYTYAASMSLAASQGQDPGNLVSIGGTMFSHIIDASPSMLWISSPEFYEDPDIQQTVGPIAQGVLQTYAQIATTSPEAAQSLYGQLAQQLVQPVNTPTYNPQSGLVSALENLTGQQLHPTARTDLLPGYYGVEGILNNPFTQALVSGTTTPLYRTTDTSGWQRFAGLPAFGGVQTGIRSGQDINFNAFSRMLPSQQEMVQGLMMATGQYWKDNVEQMLRSSPGGLSQNAANTIGQRRFW